MLSGIELDSINSSYYLEGDSSYFDESYYSLVEETYSQNGKINLISININKKFPSDWGVYGY